MMSGGAEQTECSLIFATDDSLNCVAHGTGCSQRDVVRARADKCIGFDPAAGNTEPLDFFCIRQRVHAGQPLQRNWLPSRSSATCIEAHPLQMAHNRCKTLSALRVAA